MWAVRKTDKDMVELLLEKGANTDIRPYVETPLIFAATYGSKEIVDILIRRGAYLHARDSRGDTALSKAASNGRLDIVDSLVSNGAWIELGDSYGRTPLIKAAEEGCKNVVEYLIEKGADVNAETYDGETAWMIASWNNKKEILEVLIEKGAKIDLEKYYQKKAKITYAKDSETRKMLVDAVKQRNKKEKGLIIGSIKNLFER